MARTGPGGGSLPDAVGESVERQEEQSEKATGGPSAETREEDKKKDEKKDEKKDKKKDEKKDEKKDKKKDEDKDKSTGGAKSETRNGSDGGGDGGGGGNETHSGAMIDSSGAGFEPGVAEREAKSGSDDDKDKKKDDDGSDSGGGDDPTGGPSAEPRDAQEGEPSSDSGSDAPNADAFMKSETEELGLSKNQEWITVDIEDPGSPNDPAYVTAGMTDGKTLRFEATNEHDTKEAKARFPVRVNGDDKSGNPRRPGGVWIRTPTLSPGETFDGPVRIPVPDEPGWLEIEGGGDSVRIAAVHRDRIPNEVEGEVVEDPIGPESFTPKSSEDSDGDSPSEPSPPSDPSQPDEPSPPSDPSQPDEPSPPTEPETPTPPDDRPDTPEQFDPEVERVSVPDSVNAGEPVPVLVDVRNPQSGASGTVTVSVAGEEKKVDLSPGESRSVEIDVPESDISSESVSVSVTNDETGEEVDSTTEEIDAATPEFVIGSVESPDAVAPNGTGTISVPVENVGEARGEAEVSVGNETYTVDVPAGESRTVEHNLADSGVSKGGRETYDISVENTATGETSESESESVSTTPGEFTIRNISLPSRAPPGQTVDGTVNVANDGDVTGEVQVEAGETEKTVELSPGETRNVDFSVEKDPDQFQEVEVSISNPRTGETDATRSRTLNIIEQEQAPDAPETPDPPEEPPREPGRPPSEPGGGEDDEDEEEDSGSELADILATLLDPLDLLSD